MQKSGNMRSKMTDNNPCNHSLSMSTLNDHNQLKPKDKHATEINLTNIWMAVRDSRPTYHGNELKGSEEL